MWLVGPYLLPVIGIKPQFLGRLDFTVVTILAELFNYNEELHKLFSSANMIKMTNLRTMKRSRSLTLNEGKESKG